MKVELLSVWGDDNTVVDIARVSYNKKADNYPQAANDKLLKYLADHNHWCYDEKTEIFTRRGWVYFKDLTTEDYVAEVFDFKNPKMQFVKPNQIYKNEYEGNMILAESGTCDYCVTPNHKMIFKKRNKKGYSKEFKINNAEEVYGKTKLMLNSASIIPDYEINYNEYYEGYYKAFLLADGFKQNNKKICFRLKKESKIKSLLESIIFLDLSYKTKITSLGVTEIIVETEDAIWLQKSVNKCPNFNIFEKSYSFLKGMFDGFNNSDGNRKRNTYSYSSVSKSLIDCYSNIAVLLGFSVGKISIEKREGNHNTLYKIIVLTRKHTVINNRGRVDEKIIFYSGNIYCVTVNSGFILTRRNEKTLVCGNSPFSHPRLQFRLEIPIYVERQLV